MAERVLRDELELVRGQERQRECSLPGRKDSGDKATSGSQSSVTKATKAKPGVENSEAGEVGASLPEDPKEVW